MPKTKTEGYLSNGNVIPAGTDISSQDMFNWIPGTPPQVSPQVSPDTTSEVTPTMSTNLSQEELKQLQDKRDQELGALQGTANASFDEQIRQVGRSAETAKQSDIARAGVSRGFNLSSAESVRLQDIQNRADTMVRDLETKKAEFIRTGRLDIVEQYDNSIAELTKAKADAFIKEQELIIKQQAETRLQTQMYNNLMMGMEKLGLDREKFIAGEQRLNRSVDLKEAQFLRTVSKEDKENAIETIKRMAESQMPLINPDGTQNISDEQIYQLEAEAGLPPGSFEAFYNRVFEEASMGITMDKLKIQKLQADIARTYQLASGSGGSNENITEDNFNMDLNNTIKEINSLKEQGGLGNLRIDNVISRFMDKYGYSPDNFEEVKALINQSVIEGGVTRIPEEEPASDFSLGNFNPAQSLWNLTQKILSNTVGKL